MQNHREDDLNREIQSHLDLEAQEQREAGLTPREARDAARRAFGNVTLVKEFTRETWGFAVWERLWRDLYYAVRLLHKAPGFTAAAVLSLALGIGANTAIFSLLNAVVLRPLPVPEPQQLVQLTYTWPGMTPNWNSYFGYPQLERLREKTTTLSGIIGGVTVGRMNVAWRGIASLARGDAYTDNLFSVLGMVPQHGRFFISGDDRPGAAVAVLSDTFWRTRFAADPSVIGQPILVNQLPFTVIGIAPADFHGLYAGAGTDVWLPLRALDRLKPDPKRWQEPFSSWVHIVGRLKPGVAPPQAQPELDVIYRQLLAEHTPLAQERGTPSLQRFVRDSHILLRPAATGIVSGLRDTYALPLKLLMWVAAIVILIACANLANLLLARAANRSREIAVRLALGAGMVRVVRQFLTESLLLAAMGGTLALLIAWWGSAALVRMISTGDSPIPLDIRPDWRVFAFTAAISLLTGILFGIAPALRATRMDPGPVMKDGAAHSTQPSRLLDRMLVMVQVALSLVLITGAGLFGRTLQNIWRVNVGYERDNILMFSVDAKLAGYSRSQTAPLYREILQTMSAVPGVQSATVSIVRPVDSQYYLVDRIATVDDRRLPEAETIKVAWNGIGPGYFSTIGTPIILGRDFDPRDEGNASPKVIINESLARQALPGENPIGHRLEDAQIIGVVKDTPYTEVREKIRPVLYRSLLNSHGPNPYDWVGVGDVSFELRYVGQASRPVGLLDDIRRRLASVNRALPIFRVKTLRAQTQDSLLRERLLATLSTFFGGLALLLACVGLYGLMAYAVARRTSEIGIRMALGAGRTQILWLVLRETLGLAFAGIALGIPLALWVARYAKTLLFGVAATDPLSIAAAIVALIAVALLAGYLPARRALHIEPVSALKYE